MEKTGYPDLSNLPQCVEDIRRSVGTDVNSAFRRPRDYDSITDRLEKALEKLPPLYLGAAARPFIQSLRILGRTRYLDILSRDLSMDGEALLLLNIADAILQAGEGYNEVASAGFQETVCDLYDGFLSAEDRRGVKPPDRGIIPPLVMWGNSNKGPYTWNVRNTEIFGLKVGIISLPPIHAQCGLLAWGSLSHETVGHNILRADSGLRGEVSRILQSSLDRGGISPFLTEYWASRLDEAASDVLGILNMGPMAGVSLIGYIRGVLSANSRPPKLRNTGPSSSTHPADVLRGYLAASTVRRLAFDAAIEWADAINNEVDKDVSQIVLENREVAVEDARRSASIVADALVSTPLESLEWHALGWIQNWRNQDEELLAQLIDLYLLSDKPLPEIAFTRKFYAAHVVASAIKAAVSFGVDIQFVFNKMLLLLKAMHDKNPAWGPLFIPYSGDVVAHQIFDVDYGASRKSLFQS